MTLRIEVTVPDDVIRGRAEHTPASYLDTAMTAIGFSRALASGLSQLAGELKNGAGGLHPAAQALEPREGPQTGGEADVRGSDPETAAASEAVDADGVTTKSADVEPIRLRGQPSGDRKRRTKEEMAEDKTLEDAAEKAGVPIEKVDAILANGTSREVALRELSAVAAETAKLADKPQSGITITGQTGVTADESQLISTGENRVGPEDEQDRADEAAESAAKSGGSLTLDDLRRAAGDYQKAYGMAAAVKDVEVILGCKMNDVADGDLETAIGLLRSAIDENPHNRDRVGAKTAETPAVAKPAEAPRTATKQDVIDAMLAYAKKYDGPDATPTDPATMPFTTADAPQVFTKLFGAEVNRLGLIPDSPENYGKAVAGLEEMLAKDPFKRGAK